ncbi:MAG TPA: GGDEF domain-containing protein [Rhodanobacteraceae bacterium]
MRRILIPICFLLASVAVLPALPAHAATQSVGAILARLQRHGYDAPTAIIHELETAPDRPRPDASVDVRRRYFGTLGMLAVTAHDATLYKQMLAALGNLSKQNHCDLCQAQQLILRMRWGTQNASMDESLSLLAKAEPLLGQHPPAELQIQYLAARASVYRGIGNLAESIKDAVTAYQLAIASNAPARQVEVGILLAVDNAEFGEFERADSRIKDAIDLARRIDYGYELAYAYLNLGHIRSLESRRDQQRDALMASYNIAQGKPDLAEAQALALSNLADYYLDKHDNVSAYDFAKRAAAIARQYGQQRSLSAATVNMGIAMAGMGQLDAGIATVKQAIDMAKRMDNREYVIGMLDALIGIYERAGRYRDADAALHQVANYQASLTKQQRDRAILALQEQFATELKTQQIKRLSSENARQQELVRARDTQRWLWFAVAVAFGFGMILLTLLLRSVRRANRTLNATNQTLSEESAHDPLTGAYNRRHFELVMRGYEEATSLAPPVGESQSVGLVMLDLDHFKHVNDTYGHDAGDTVLVTVVTRLRALLRQRDEVVRWGGEELVLILPGTGVDGITVLLKRLLGTIGDTPVKHGDKRIPITASAGGVAFPMRHGQTWKEAIQIADLAMYMSKITGRNRGVCVTRIDPDISLPRVHQDLLAAQAAGEATLVTVPGPGTASVVAA